MDLRDGQAQALRDVAAAGAVAVAAKHEQSVASPEHAERQLHAAVDIARELGVEWGRIGSALGIARGCAYQRYRKRRTRQAAKAA
jgi:hypothetical protein